MLLPSFIQKKDDPISMEIRSSPFKTEKEDDAFLVHYDIFFLLDSQVVSIFCHNKCLTTLRLVMRITYIRSSSKRSSGCLFKDDNRSGDTVSKRHMPYSVRDVCLDLTCR